MSQFNDIDISRTIVSSYHNTLHDRLESDVAIVGAGPAGMVAAAILAQAGAKVTIFEKRLAPGGGIWGGAMGMNIVAVQEEALPILQQIGIRYRPGQNGVYAVDAMELGSGLCWHALHSGAVLLNLATVEDLCVHAGRVSGVVVNRTMIAGALPVDPLSLAAKAVLDATGHDAMMVQSLRKRGLPANSDIEKRFGEGPMDAAEGERFVVDRACEVYPGLWIAGMSVCSTLGGPRMGPVFGGMLLSGQRVARLIAAELKL